MERYLIHWNLASVRINSLLVLYWALSRFFSTSKLTGLHTPGCGGGGKGAFRRQTKVGKLNSCWKTHVACENDATTVSKHVGELLPRIKTSFFFIVNSLPTVDLLCHSHTQTSVDQLKFAKSLFCEGHFENVVGTGSPNIVA